MYSSIPVLHIPFLLFDTSYLCIWASLMSSLLWCFCLLSTVFLWHASWAWTLPPSGLLDRFFYCFWPRICMTDTHIFNRKLLLQWIVFIIWSLVLLTICWICGKEDLVGSQEKLFNNKGIEEDLKLLRSHDTENFEKWSKGIWIWGDLGNSSALLFYSVEIRVCQDKNPS